MSTVSDSGGLNGLAGKKILLSTANPISVNLILYKTELYKNDFAEQINLGLNAFSTI